MNHRDNYPCYTTPKINERIDLYEGPFHLTLKGMDYPGEGTIVLEWLPQPRTRFVLRSEQRGNPLGFENALLEIPTGLQPVEARIRKKSLSLTDISPKTEFHGSIDKGLEIGNGRELTDVLVHIPNFHDFFPSPATVSVDGWNVELERLPYIDEQFYGNLRESGGFALTHIGFLCRTDGQSFTVAEIQSILEPLRLYLWFCLGRRTGPILPCGFNTSDKPVWQEWASWNIDRFKASRNWFVSASSNWFSTSFPGFLNCWQIEESRESLKFILHWYVESNQLAGGLEGGIILAQAALELLSWTILVQDKKILSDDGFSKLAATDKIRLLVGTIGIPLNIPTFLQDLSALAKGLNWRDGPQAVGETRNALVHPNPDKRKKITQSSRIVTYECWSLSLWYVELTLLWWFGYAGSYSNRLIRGVFRGEEIQYVPWK